MFSNIKVVIFDVDGTLVDAYKAIALSLNRALADLNYPTVSQDEVRRKVGWGQVHLLESFFKKEDINKALSIYRHFHKHDLKAGLRILPGVKELIKELKSKNFILAIASNRPTPFTEIILKQISLLSYFDQILCSDLGVKPKPDPEMLNMILQKNDCTELQAVYVGDMVLDVECGKNAGIKTFAVTTGSSSRDQLEKVAPFKILNKIGELIEFI